MTPVPPANLTTTETRLFAQLADGEWHSAEALLNQGLGKRFAAASLVPTHIGRLRKKLAPHQRIENAVGGGYRLVQLEPAK